jgi:hypothetical protein
MQEKEERIIKDMKLVKPFLPTLYLQASVVHLSKIDMQHSDDIGNRGFYGRLKVRVGCGLAASPGGEAEVDLEGGRPKRYSKAGVGVEWTTGLTVDPKENVNPSNQLRDKKAKVVFEVWGVDEEPGKR